MTKKGHNYKDSGVNIEEGQSFVRDIQNSTSRTKHRYSMGILEDFLDISNRQLLLKILSMPLHVTEWEQS